MVERGILDIAPSDLTINKARSTVVDFLPTLAESYQQIFLSNPADALHWSAYVEPFTPICWVGILIFVVVVPPIIAGIIIYGNVI